MRVPPLLPTWVRARHTQRATYYRYKFQSSVGAYEDKTAVLSDADTVWTDVRHMHMREAIDKLMADFNKFMTDNAGFKGCVRSRRHSYRTALLTLIQRGCCYTQ